MLCIFRDYVNLFWFLTWPDGDAMAHRHFPTAMIGAPQELFGAAFVVCYATKQKRKHGRKKQPNRFFLQASSARTPLLSLRYYFIGLLAVTVRHFMACTTSQGGWEWT